MSTEPNTVTKMGSAPLIILAAITIAQASEAFLVQGLPSLSPFIQADFNLSKAALGAVMSAVYTGLTFSSIPWGFVIDFIGVRKTLLSGLVLLGTFAIIGSMTSSVNMLWLCLLVAGIGFASVYPSTTKAVMYWAPPSLRGTFMGIKQTGVTLGGALAAGILPAMAVASGWKATLSKTGFMVIVMGVVCYILYREHAQEKEARKSSTGKSMGKNMLALLKSGNMWKINLAGLCLQTCQVCSTSWMMLYLNNDIGFSVVAAGGVLALFQSGGMVGRMLLPMISDSLAKGKRKPVLIAVCVIQTIAIGALSLISRETPQLVIYIQAVLMGAVVMGWVPLVTVLRAEVAGREATGTATTLGSTVNSFGNMFGPALFGLIVDSTGSFKFAWRVLLMVSAAGLAISSIVEENKRMFQK